MSNHKKDNKVAPLMNFVAAATVSAVGIGGILAFQGAATSNEVLKIGAGIAVLSVVAGTIRLLSRHRAAINILAAICMLFFLSIVPIVRIVLEMSADQGMRGWINAIVLVSPYYFLPFVALALLALMAQSRARLDVLLRCCFLPIIVLALLLTATGFVKISASEVVDVHMLYNNLFIPMALLLLFLPSRRNNLIGAIGLGAIVILSILQSSRSYLLVAFYALFFAFIFSSNESSSRWKVVLVVAFAGAFLASMFGSVILENTEIVEKLRLEELEWVFAQFWKSGDVGALFYWDGNSRSRILIDAFTFFTFDDFVFGRGVTATYDSFVTRNTIEIGYAQELFWLGLVTVIPALFFTVIALWGVLLRKDWRRSQVGSSFLVIGVVRVLDGLIYGMPVSSVYMLLYWMAVMSFALKKGARSSLFRSVY